MSKILIVSNSTYPYYTDGQAVVIDILRKGLVSEGNSVEILTILPPEDVEKVNTFDGTPYHYLSIDPSIRFDAARQLFTKISYFNPEIEEEFTEILNKVNPDIVNFHTFECIGANLIEVAKNKGKKVIQNIHDYTWICPHPFLMKDNGNPYKSRKIDYEEWGRAIGGWEEYILEHNGVNIPKYIDEKFKYLKKVLEKVDLAITPSNYMKEDYILNGFNEKKFVVISNPVPKSPIKYHPKDDSQTLVFGHLAGYDIRGKGVDVAVEAFKGINKNINIRLEVIATSDPNLKISFKRFLAILKYYKSPALLLKEYYAWVVGAYKVFRNKYKPKRISYLPKYNPKDRYKIISRLDVLLVPSIYRESFSLTTAEGLSYGIPVIASNRGGMVDMIENGVNGLLVEQGDIKALREAIEKIATNRELFKKLCGGTKNFKPFYNEEYAKKFIENLSKI